MPELGLLRNGPTCLRWRQLANGTMPENVAKLAETVVGRRIVSVEPAASIPGTANRGNYRGTGTRIILDNGKSVYLVDTDDCCAYTNLEKFLLHPELVNHAILGVGTTGGYTKWHIYADMGDILELEVEWSCGNPFYYGYGFDIVVDEHVSVPAGSTP
jgi:hypothetical protein